MPQGQQSLKKLFYHKGQSQGHKVIDLSKSVICKGIIGWTSMQNMKSLSLSVSKL